MTKFLDSIHRPNLIINPTLRRLESVSVFRVGPVVLGPINRATPETGRRDAATLHTILLSTRNNFSKQQLHKHLAAQPFLNDEYFI
jgi:hypothetical protein